MKIPAHLFCVAVFCIASCAQAQFFQDDFESNTTVSTAAFPDPAGAFDPDNPAVGSWSLNYYGGAGDPTAAQVSSFTGSGQPPSARSGSNYLISGNHGMIDEDFGFRGVATANLTSSVGQATVDFWVWGNDDQFDIIRGRQLDASTNETTFELTLFGGFEVKWESKGGNGGLELDAQLINNAWNHIVLEFDGAQEMAHITVNDEPTESFSTDLDPQYTPTTFNLLQFRSEYTGFFDDALISVPLDGDFDGDGDVDGFDFLEWQRNPGIGNLADWEANYSSPISAATTAVPEPTTLSLLTLVVCLTTARRRS